MNHVYYGSYIHMIATGVRGSEGSAHDLAYCSTTFQALRYIFNIFGDEDGGRGDMACTDSVRRIMRGGNIQSRSKVPPHNSTVLVWWWSRGH
jgi:hypothetical protein